jgi:lipoyl-dependent peroxiredoxin
MEMAVQRRAHVEWEGNLPGGRGTFTAGSGAMEDMAVTWASRVERPDGKTSPEELLAAAHASCYAMALAHTLAGKGVLIEGLTVEAVATLDEERLRISAVDLDVRGSVAGLSEEEFGRLAQEAESVCPVSNAIRTNVEVRLRANLLED